MEFKILDIFSGAGGFSKGFDMNQSFETKVAVDFDRDALKTFENNFPSVKIICGDLTAVEVKEEVVNAAKRNNVNMIIGGPPCQGFSLQGKKLGLNDPRNFLYKEFVYLVSKIRPEVFVMENVKNMITTENGYFINLIQKDFSDIGYKVSYEILNSKNFGVPQKRERSFIIGSLTKKITLENKIITKEISVREAISDLNFLKSGEGSFVQEYKINESSNYQKKMKKNSKNLYNHKATNHSEIAIKKLKMIPSEKGKEYLPKEYHGRQKFNSTWSRLVWDEQSPTIDTRFDTPSNGKNSHPVLNRAITPREAARIQSFPDNFIFYGNKTSVCKQIGNAVPPLLSLYIADVIENAYDLNKFKNDKYELFKGDAYSVFNEIKKIDHIITDPPYNISKKNNFNTMKNKREGVDFGDWDKNFDYTGWLDLYLPKLKKGGTVIIFCSYIYISEIINKLIENDIEVKDIIRWIKDNPMPRNMKRRYVSDYELAIWGVKKGEKWIFNNNTQNYLRPEIRTSVVSGKERYNHPTQKSLMLMRKLIAVHTNENDIVFDPFMGTGTTGEAAIKENRKFIGIEKEIEYYEITKNRLKNKR